MIPNVHCGHRMRIAREEVGLEVREIAERIGIAPSTVIRYEKGRTKPKRLVLRAWSEVTGVPIYWLEWGMTEAPTPTPVASGVGASAAKLPRLDSNQQPAGYGPLRPVRHPDGSIQSTSDKVRRVNRPAVFPFPTAGLEDLAA